MKYGIFIFPTEYSIRVDQLARAVEERGFDSLWLPEHSHIPVERRSHYPAGGPLPKPYFHIADPFVGLAAAAAVTTKIKLGTASCLVVEHDPIILAKKVASLDLLSGGRFIFGIAGGWNAEEMENHRTVFRTRWRKLSEFVEAMKLIWAEKEAQYHGKFVKFEPIWSYPKPVQKPWPPIFLAGEAPAVRQRVVQCYEGWMPAMMALDDFLRGIEEVRRMAREQGRDPRSISISMVTPRADGYLMDRYAAAGVDRVMLGLPSAREAEVLRKLDEHAKLAEL